MSSITMSLKESSVLAPSGPTPLFSKFKSRAKEVESPKSVILDPRIVSPTSSASASLERRLTDLKKGTRHDRVHSVSDAEDEGALPGVNLSAAVLSRQLSAKASSGHMLLESVSEAQSSPSMAPRLAQRSGVSSETASPRNRLSKNSGKDGAKVPGRGSENEFVNRRLSLSGADTTSGNVVAPLPPAPDHEEEYSESFPYSPAKSSNHGESGRPWRNAAGLRDPRPILSQTLARQPVQGTSRSEGKGSLRSEGKKAVVGSMYSLLMKGFHGPNAEEISSDESLSGDSNPSKNDSELCHEDEIELNKFVVRDSAGEDIKHKIAWSPSHGSSREHRNSFSGDGRSGVSCHRQSKVSKSNFSPSESPGHLNGFNESDSEVPRSALVELSPDFVTKTSLHGGKESPGMQTVQRETTRTYTLTKSTSHNDYFDRIPATKTIDGWRRSVDSQLTPTSLFSGDGSPSLHALPSLQPHTGVAGAGFPDGSNGVERRLQGGGKVAMEANKINLLSQQRFVPGQFLKSNPLNPRPSPAKWDDAEKWLVNPASVKSNAHSHHGNGHLSSGGSTPQHASQFHAPALARHHQPVQSSNHSTRVLGTVGDSNPVNSEPFDARLVSEHRDARDNTYSLPNAVPYQRSYESSAATDRHEESLPVPVDVKVSEMSSRDDSGARPEDKFANSVTVQTTSASSGRLIVVTKDAATEITPSTSQRDMATQVTPAPSFHAAATPPRLHTNNNPARLNTTPVHSERRPASVGVDVTELQNCHQAKLELDQAATVDTNWTTREEEAEESAKSLRLSVSRSVDFRDVKRNVLEARAAAWEEAEQSKHIARYHREEAKILAWEAHQKAKAEAGMRKMEVKLERMRSHAHEQLQNRLSSVHMKAENMRAAAAVECGEQASKTNHWAHEIHVHGRSSSPPLVCCFPRFNTSCSPIKG